MTKYKMKQEFKKYLKLIATQIREKKNLRKGSEDGYVEGLVTLKYEYRHHHIAYCLIRGRTIKQIENNYDPNNYYPKLSYVKDIKNQWMEKIDEEVIRDCAA
jgi:hypothetical protein